MRANFFLAIILIWCQEIEDIKTIEVLHIIPNELVDIRYDRQTRSITDIWNSIKTTANHAWEYIKNLAINIRERIADWIAKIKIKAQDLAKTFEEQLNKMKDRVNEFIENVKETGETVKKCLQERKKEIDDILKNILFDVTNCISNSLTYLTNVAAVQYKPIVDQTEYLKIIQNDLNDCVEKYKTNEEVEECIQNIRKGIYKNMTVTEEYILQNHTEMRGATDDLLNTIVGCTTDGIIKSTTIIANETIQIIECVSGNV